MRKVTSYAPGTPCWVDLSCADIDASVSFYADLLGWELEQSGGEETGGYRRARFEGDDVAALMPAMEAGRPQMWQGDRAAGAGDGPRQGGGLRRP